VRYSGPRLMRSLGEGGREGGRERGRWVGRVEGWREKK
jgi:hypothetical protein